MILSAIALAILSSACNTSFIPVTIPLSSRPITRIPPAVFAKAIRVLMIGLIEDKSLLNSNVLLSLPMIMSSISTSLLTSRKL
jgi:hypothetical protein